MPDDLFNDDDPSYDDGDRYWDPNNDASSGGGGGFGDPWGGGAFGADPGSTGAYRDPGTGSGFYDSRGNWVSNPGYQLPTYPSPVGTTLDQNDPRGYGVDDPGTTDPTTGLQNFTDDPVGRNPTDQTPPGSGGPNPPSTLEDPPDIPYPTTPYPTSSPKPLPPRGVRGVINNIGRVVTGGGATNQGGVPGRVGQAIQALKPPPSQNSAVIGSTPPIASNLPGTAPNTFQPIGIQTPGAGAAGAPPSGGAGPGGMLMNQIMARALRQRQPQPQPQDASLSYDDAAGAAGV